MYLIQTKDKLHICYERFESAYYCACGLIVVNYKINSTIVPKNIFGLNSYVNVSCEECLAIATGLADFESSFKKSTHYHNLIGRAFTNKILHTSEVMRAKLEKSSKYNKYKK